MREPRRLSIEMKSKVGKARPPYTRTRPKTRFHSVYLTAGRGSSISQHLRATKKILQGVVFNAEYVLSVEMRRVRGLILKFAGSQGPWMQLRLSEPTKSMRRLHLIRDVF